MPVPSSGVFEIWPRTIAVMSGEFSVTAAGAPPPQATQAQVEAYLEAQVVDFATAPRLWQNIFVVDRWVPTAKTYSVEVTPNTTEIVFNPYTTPQTVDFLSADLPMGMICSNLIVWWHGSRIVLGRNHQITNFKIKYFGSTIYNIDNPPDLLGDLYTGSLAIIPFSTFWGVFNIFKNFTFEVTVVDLVTGVAASIGLITDKFSLYGDYRQWSTQLTLVTPMGGPNSLITITDGSSQLGAIAGFGLSWEVDTPDPITGQYLTTINVPAGNVIVHTSGTVKFYIPSRRYIFNVLKKRPPRAGKKISITATGTQFTGSINLGTLNATLVDGSGVYNLTPNKRNDTYYDRSTTPSTTVDLKIPDPLAKTGFF